MERLKFFTWFLGLVVILAGAQTAWAAIYSFTDERGVVHFSNVPNNPRYREIVPDKPIRRPGKTVSIDGHIHAAASVYNIDPNLVKAVIMAESSFNQRAVSKKGAIGLMQLMPGTARDMNVVNPYDPGENIHGGTRYLKNMLRIFDNDLKLALAAYNAGPNLVRQLGRVPQIAETQEYIRRVLHYYRYYKST